MGEHAAITAREWGIGRSEQDELALESHVRLASAYRRGFFDDLVTPYLGLTRDQNLRPDPSLDKLATLKLGPVQAAERVPMDSPVGRWAVTALTARGSGDTPTTELVRIRMMGGTVPTDVLVEAMRVPFVLVPTVNPDNNQHSHDENLRIGNFVSGTRAVLGLLTTAYAR